MIGTGGAPAAADTSTQLPISSYRDMAVDGIHRQVFITDPFGGQVVVADYSGQVVKQFSGAAGAWGLALSEDSNTLYVALRDAGAIAEIDTATLQETARYDTGTGAGAYAGPTWLALAGGKVWFGYSVDTWSGDLGSLDLSGPEPVVTRAQAPRTFDGPPQIAAVPEDPSTLVAADHFSDATLVRYDVSSGRAVEQVRSHGPGPYGCASLNELALTPDARQVVLACASPYDHQAFRTADLSHDGFYTTDAYPNAVAFAPDGTLALGSDARHDDAWVYRPGYDAPLKAIDLGADRTVTGGLAWAPDHSRLFAVVTTYSSGPFTLKVLDDPAGQESTLLLDGPETAKRGQQITITGTLTPTTWLGAGTTVSLRRSTFADPAGVSLGTATVSPDGTLAFTDRPRTTGTVWYEAKYAGDGWLSPAESVALVEVFD
ncbi:hypothetical protein DMB38_30820 [Streptomyces sp. WAC 06738]|nr:hypothetical protein DMB38_30820 [Streptomyces sp. WAC 06738]